MSSLLVKQERRDDQEEIDQLAAKMVEANKTKLANANSSSNAVHLSSLLASSVAVNGARTEQPSLLNCLGRNTLPERKENSAQSAKDREEPLDEESQKGRFGWTDSSLSVPYLLRRGVKYCSVRFFEQRALKSFQHLLRPEILKCVSVESFYTTETEARLLNEINIKHSDYHFGREIFTVRDVIVRLSDTLELLAFLKLCQDKLTRKVCDAKDRCGFFRIAGESVVPFSVVNGIKFVPLFYFEGETGTLDKKAIQITGWDLAYLKFCCKVQGIRDELFSSDSYAAASIDEIRQQFPADTQVQLYWPSRSPIELNTNVATCSWYKKPAGNPPPLPATHLPPSMATPAVQKAAPLTTGVVRSTSSAVSAPSLGTPGARLPSSVGVSPSYYNWQTLPQYPVQRSLPVTASSVTSSRSSGSGSNLPAASSANRHGTQSISTVPVSPAAGLNAVTAGYMGLGMQLVHAQAAALLGLQNRQSSGTSQPVSLEPILRTNGLHRSAQSSSQGPGLVNAAAAYSSSSSPLTGAVPGLSPHSRNGAGASPRPGLPVPATGQSLAQPKPPPPLIPVNGSSYPAYSVGSSLRQQLQKSMSSQQQQQQHEPPPFKVQTLPIENQMIPCVNSRQYVFNNFMVALHDVAAYLFPRFGHHACKQVLQDGLRVTLYEANAQQLQALRAEGKSSSVNSAHGEKIYLVNVRDIIQYMPQIKYMMSRLDMGSMNHAPPAKRHRIS